MTTTNLMEANEIIAELEAQRDELQSQIALLCDALERIRDKAESWHGRSSAPYWNLGDIAAAALLKCESARPEELESDGRYDKCPKCGRFAVQLATTATISFYADCEDKAGEDSQYMDEYRDMTADDGVSLWAHICFECDHVVDVGMEGKRS